VENWLLPLLVLAMEVKVLQKEVDKKSPGLGRKENIDWKRKACEEISRLHGLQFGFADPCPIVLQVTKYFWSCLSLFIL